MRMTLKKLACRANCDATPQSISLVIAAAGLLCRPHYSGTTLDAQARYAAGTKEILRRTFDNESLNETDVIVQVFHQDAASVLSCRQRHPVCCAKSMKGQPTVIHIICSILAFVAASLATDAALDWSLLIPKRIWPLQLHDCFWKMQGHEGIYNCRL